MPYEKPNDINSVHAPRRGYNEALHPSVINGCWCGATTGPLRWGGRLWCDDCIPGDVEAEAVRELPRSIPGDDVLAAVRELVPSLTKSVHRLCAILEAIATHGGTLTLNKMDAAAPREPMPLQPGDRAIYNGRRGVLRSIGVAGTGILYDDGRYALLTNAQAARLVRE